MKSLVRIAILFVGARIARLLERGSRGGAFIGAAVGAAAALGLVWWLSASARVDSVAAISIVLVVALTVPAAIAGSMLGPTSTAGGVGAPDGRVRLSRYNKALVPLVPIGLAAAFAGYVFSQEPGSDEATYVYLGCGAVAAIALVVLLRAVLYVEIDTVGRRLTVGRLLGARAYDAGEVASAGFERRDDESDGGTSERVVLIRLRPGERTVRLEVREEDVERASAALKTLMSGDEYGG
jgi:hypothetical protein